MRGGVSSRWVVVEGGPQTLGVRLAEVVLSRLRRRIEGDRARRAVDVAAHRRATSGGKTRRRDVTAHRRRRRR